MIYAIVSQPGFDQFVMNNAHGSAQPNVSADGIGRILIPQFHPAEQLAIGRCIGALDEKIESNHRTSRTLERVARAIFRAWFVDYEPVKAKAAGARSFPSMPQQAFDALPTRLVGSELGPLPEGWMVDSIRNRASNIQYGFTQSATEKPIGPYFLRITDIRGGKINWSSVPFCEATDQEREKYRIEDGDIFVARTGASTGDSIYIVEPPVAVFASYLVRIQFDSRGIGRLVGEFMRSPEYASHVAGTIGGSAQPNASAQMLTAANLVFPTDDIADSFYGAVRPLDVRRAAYDRESHKLAAVRDYLLPKLLTGEVRVQDLGNIVGEDPTA